MDRYKFFAHPPSKPVVNALFFSVQINSFPRLKMTGRAYIADCIVSAPPGCMQYNTAMKMELYVTYVQPNSENRGLLQLRMDHLDLK